MLYLTGTMVSRVDLAYYGVSRTKDWVSVDSGTKLDKREKKRTFYGMNYQAYQCTVARYTLLKIFKGANDIFPQTLL